RLDSDDILAVDHVERLRQVLTPNRCRVVNFLEGAILSITDGVPRLYRVEDDSNPFAALMEPMGPEVKTIWGEMHIDIAK
ncbi:hypothetical protein J8J27_34250, partial [Mycobacterium tuberculosis]|nr:hypothetical protein [Mycobacterium tuberculosis]